MLTSPLPATPKTTVMTRIPYQVPGLDSATYVCFSAAGARIYHSQIGAKDHEWTNSKLRGTLLFGADVSYNDSPYHVGRKTEVERSPKPGSYWFRLLDETSGKPVWKLEVPVAGLVYRDDRPFFHTFQGLTRKFGFLFDEDEEAATFYREVTGRVSPSSTSAASSPASQRTLAAPERPKTKSRSSSFVTMRSKSSSPSPPPSPSKSHKPSHSKSPVSPSMITLPDPSSFAHVSHIGLDEWGTMEANKNKDDSWTAVFEAAKAKVGGEGGKNRKDEARPAKPERANTIPASRSTESSRSFGFASKMRRKLTSPSFHMF